MSDQRGATAEDWYQFDFVLGLGANLLPCVPASDDVRVVEGSALKDKVGKIPSQFNAAGLAHGLLEWQKRPILGNEIKIWSADRRLNLCVRTGPISGVYAFDVDVEDERASMAIAAILQKTIDTGWFARERPSSNKFLVPFLMEEPCKKRKIKLDNNPKGPAIELLADGQQFVAAGTHFSGSRYRWSPDLPSDLPTLPLAKVNEIWETLTQRFATSSSTRTGTPTASAKDQNQSRSGTDDTNSVLSTISDTDWQALLQALPSLLEVASDNDTWSKIGYALLSLQGTRPARQLWLDFSQKAAGYEPGAPEAWWQAHYRQATRTDYRHIFTMARQRGWGATSSPEVFLPVQTRDSRERAGGVAVSELASDTDKNVHGGSGGSDGPNGTDAAARLDVIPSAPDKQIVRLVAKDFSQIIDQLERIAQDELFTQANNLVYRQPAHADAQIRRDTDQLMLVSVTRAYARKRLGELAKFEKWSVKKDNWVPAAPSAEHINALIEQGSWTTLRPLDAIARAPFVRADGSICDATGYDKASRTILVPSAKFPPVPEHPDREMALAALGRLREVFHQFPWRSGASESGFLAHVLSEAGRLAISKCPMFIYNAPDAGTGKTLLQKAAAIIVHGTMPALRPWVGDGDETRKTVYASLLAGDRSLLFDNVPTGIKIRSAELCVAITAEEYKDRKLGESEARGVPNKAVFSASGNNIKPAGDLVRRSVVIRLDANTEKLSQRRFDIEDLESYLIRERPRLLVDALTIIRAYHRTPATDMTMPVALGAFEQWSHLIREPLIWLGLPDPVATQTEDDADEDRTDIASACALLVARFALGEFTAVDIARSAGAISDSNGQLTNAMISSGCKDPNSPRDIGSFLSRNKDRVFNGMKLVRGAHGMVGTKWKFVKVE